MGIAFSHDVGRYRRLKACFAKLLEERGAEQGIIKRRRPQADQRVLVRAAVAVVVGAADPKRENPQDAASLLAAVLR